ncbi:hypothetical protein Bra471DRAFT_00882 [Bradyrhizobium sp. WSM471]|nr:hypothetical protein Bra471DRAFT_00882 [Bradyrhizobium sp. WSM471]
MNFQVTVLKILVSYPDGFAVMDDLKRDMAILATSGRDWADRTKRLAAQVPDLDIFSQGLVERIRGVGRSRQRVGQCLSSWKPARRHPSWPNRPQPMRLPNWYPRQRRFLRCGNLLTVPSGGVNAANVVVRRANARERTPLEVDRSQRRNRPLARRLY